MHGTRHGKGTRSPLQGSRAPVLLLLLLAGLWGNACGVTYDQASFKATHNSYSGGERGSILGQLDSGVRFIELDVHSDDYLNHGYRIGHDFPGHQVSLGAGNPDTSDLGDWLEVLVSWSADNPGHAPITLLIDLKDSLDEASSYQEGNLAALNETLLGTLTDKLYMAEGFLGAWPLVEDLRDRFLVVLSGDAGARLAYLMATGRNLSVAMNASGQVVELHDSASGTLAYWTGTYRGDATVRWHRHGRLDPGRNPAVALHRDGWVVSVYEPSETGQGGCVCRTGRLAQDDEIAWDGDMAVALPAAGTCQRPTVRFEPPDGNRLLAVYDSGLPGERWTLEGSLDPTTGGHAWGDPELTPAVPLPDKTTALLEDGRTVAVFTSAEFPFDADTLLYSTNEVTRSLVRYRQVAFSEQKLEGNPVFAAAGAPFFSTGAAEDLGRLWAVGMKLLGGVVRLWGFNSDTHETPVAVNFPATDIPFSPWYEAYSEEIGTLP